MIDYQSVTTNQSQPNLDLQHENQALQQRIAVLEQELRRNGKQVSTAGPGAPQCPSRCFRSQPGH